MVLPLSLLILQILIVSACQKVGKMIREKKIKILIRINHVYGILKNILNPVLI